MRNIKLAVLFFARLLGLFRVARYITRRKLRILCYHGFELDCETSFRPQLFIKRTMFEQRLAAIHKGRYIVLPLGEAVDRLYQGSLPNNSVVITIDDGLHSVNRVAAPLLRKYGFPATVYVTSYYVRRNHPVFQLVVQYMFWKTTARRLDLRGLLPDEDRIVDLSDHKQAEAAMSEIIEHGETCCSEDQRRELSTCLGERLGILYSTVEESRILTLMSARELVDLAASGVDIQLHTHRHRFPVEKRLAQQEITDNRETLDQFVTGPKEHFCYPSGLWSRRQWPWLDELGVKSSTTCAAGLNDQDTPRHALKRFLDGHNIHPLEFAAELSGFLELLRRARALNKRAAWNAQ